MRDRQLRTCGAPGMRLVSRAVVGQHAFNGDAVACEPGDRPAQHGDSGDGPFIGADLGVSDTGVVIDHRVHERCADPRPIVRASLTGAPRGRPTVASALFAAEESVATTVGDVGELGDRKSTRLNSSHVASSYA